MLTLKEAQVRLNDLHARLTKIEDWAHADTTNDQLTTIAARLAGIENERNSADAKLRIIKQFCETMFDKAIWDIPSEAALRSPADQLMRREQTGFLYGLTLVYEKLGFDTPPKIDDIVLAMAGKLNSAATDPNDVTAPIDAATLTTAAAPLRPPAPPPPGMIQTVPRPPIVISNAPRDR